MSELNFLKLRGSANRYSYGESLVYELSCLLIIFLMEFWDSISESTSLFTMVSECTENEGLMVVRLDLND
jgi:hypothetical protein